MNRERELLQRVAVQLLVFDLKKASDLVDEIQELLAQPEQTEQASFNWDGAPVICELNGYRYYLGPDADKELNWADAKAWCESVGGELPPRDILLQAYLNEDIKPLFKESWYWSSTDDYTTTDWIQDFSGGNQDTNGKNSTNYVRTVKRGKQ